ncbi:MAG: IPT/TIG domain-containing protein, partial [Alcanivoracaceae bacterium]|nr:IPT/TIG domain-containing protein [Alcanivoracaceae bacterium]
MIEQRSGVRVQEPEAFGYGMRQLVHSRPALIYPTDVIVESDHGVALMTGGYYPYMDMPMTAIGGVPVPEGIYAATFDVQQRERLELAGGVSSIPGTGPLYQRLARWITNLLTAESDACALDLPSCVPRTPEQVALHERTGGLDIPTLPDALRLQMVQREEDGVQRRRLFVAAGNKGVVQLNGDELNGLQLISEQYPGFGRSVAAIQVNGHAVYASVFSPSAKEPRYDQCVGFGSGEEDADALPIMLYGHQEAADPVHFGSMEGVISGYRMMQQGRWLLSGGGSGPGRGRNPACPATVEIPSLGTGVTGNAVQLLDVLDPLVTRSFSTVDAPADMLIYGDYLLVAAGHWIQVRHLVVDELSALVDLTEYQEQTGNIRGLRRYGNLLLASLEHGVIALDITDPLSPKVISAGNIEGAHQVDVFRDRLIVASGEAGVRTLELPGAFVAHSSVDEGQLVAVGTPVELAFNEAMSTASLTASGAVTVTQEGSDEPLAVSVEPLDQADAGQRFRISFSQMADTQYTLSINEASNLRSGKLLLPYVVNLVTATEGASQPLVHRVENGLRHRGDDTPVVIHGEHFSATAEVRINDLPVPFVRVSAEQLDIPPGAVEMLPLKAGMHHIQVIDQGLAEYAFGSLVLAEAVSGNVFSMSPDSADIAGGNLVRIRASQEVLLPGTRVVLRSRTTGDQLETLLTPDGIHIVNLHDDVEDMRSFTFWLPGVVTPDRYAVYLNIRGREVFVGDFSYRLPKGELLSLPNYPPMVIGASVSRDPLLYVGVSSGRPPSETNRFLMKAGVEIYDVSINARPIRLAQLPTEGAVTGLSLSGDVLWAAGNAQGLLQISVADPSSPLLVRTEAVPGYQVTDVDMDASRGWLAMAAASDLGIGFVRIIDTSSDTLSPPPGLSPLVFASGELAGRPVDVAWHEQSLFVLLQIGDRLKLVIIQDLSDPESWQTQWLEQSSAGNQGLASMVVQYGRVLISSAGQLTVYTAAEDGWHPAYWTSVDSAGGVLGMQGGQLLVSGRQGLEQNALTGLALSSVSPPSGRVLGLGDEIRLQLSEFINTTSAPVAVLLRDDQGNDLSAHFTVTAINTLQGGVLTVRYDSNAPVVALSLQLTDQLLALNGQPLVQPVTLQYGLADAAALRVESAVHAVTGTRFVHADGTESVRVAGAGFGTDASQLSLYVGGTRIPSSAIHTVTDEQIEFDLPDLYLGQQTLALPVRVDHGGLSARLDGALLVIPRLNLVAINPHTGPPQGGNLVELVGHGFHQGMQVHVGGARAGDLVLLSGNRLTFRAPSGSFGYAPVTVSSPYFPGEVATSPQDYFYAGNPTGATPLASDKPSPVAALALGDQLLYAVTGGSYAVENMDGRRLKVMNSSTARLAVVDMSDPVRPRVLEKEIAGIAQPYFHEVQGGFSDTNGFVDVARDGANLYAVGGNRLLHFDLTLASDPLYLGDYTITEQVNGQPVSGRVRAVTAHDDLVFVSSSLGIHVFQRDGFNRLRLLDHIDRVTLGGTPDFLFLDGDQLWFSMEIGRRVRAIELASGNYRVTADIPTVDAAGRRFRPRDLLVSGDLLVVSTGERGSLVAYQLDHQGGAHFAAEQPLTYLLRNGALTAGRLSLVGQTLYVAAGQGDLQLYDAAAWLGYRFSNALPMRHYFAITGDVTDMRVTGRAIHAGTVFPYVNGEPTENPIEQASATNQIGGLVSTIVNDLLTVVAQVPLPEGTLAIDEFVTLDFNRLLDPAQFTAGAPPVLEVLRDGAPLAGTVRHEVFDGSSRLVFEPLHAFEADRRYTVRLRGDVRDLHGEVLGDHYNFRFVTAAHQHPLLNEVNPRYGNWRGGEEIRITGAGFGPETRIQIGDAFIDSSDFLSLTPNEVVLSLPALAASPADNLPV